jgi:hypothetical protein
MTWQPDLYHISVSSTRTFQFSTHQSCIISWVPVVTMSHQQQLAAASYIFIHYALKNKSRWSRRWWMKTVFVNRGSHGGSRLLRDLKYQSLIWQYTNLTRMSLTEFEYLLTLIGGHITKGRVGCEGKGQVGSAAAQHTWRWYRVMIRETPPSTLSVSVSRIFPLMWRQKADSWWEQPRSDHCIVTCTPEG